MAYHKAQAEATGLKIFFADPRSPWQRASNENSNGLIRQFLPKGANLNLIQKDDVEVFEWLLNTWPRDMFECRTPLEVYTDLVKEGVVNPAPAGWFNCFTCSLRPPWHLWSDTKQIAACKNHAVIRTASLFDKLL